MEAESNRRITKRTVKLKEKFAPITSSKPQNEKSKELEGAKIGRTASGEFLVRGRIFQTHKPITFNQPWTNEEQKRLEELLELHPTEETEMERWKKIAVELGNRTPVKVQSRVHKYFFTEQDFLYLAGYPIRETKTDFSRQEERKCGMENSQIFLLPKSPPFLQVLFQK